MGPEIQDDSSAGELLKIGVFAERAGTNLRTLRYYEELGLLVPAERSSGGIRYYRQADLHRFFLIQSLADLGLSLEDIRPVLDTREDGLSREAFFARVRGALDTHGRLLAERLAALQAQKARTDEALAKLTDCAACDHSPFAGNNFCEPCVKDGMALPAHLRALF